MQEFLKDIFLSVVTAAVPVLTAYLVVCIRKVGKNAAANTENIQAKSYITEAAEAITAASAATNQTYADALKNAGKYFFFLGSFRRNHFIDKMRAGYIPGPQTGFYGRITPPYTGR